MSEMREKIKDLLKEVELCSGVRILFATVAGSRLLGYASPNSDYDVKFIYLKPTASYLRLPLGGQKDTIEIPGEDVSLSGWDVSKTIPLCLKSNPSLSKWLYGQDIVENCPKTVARLRELCSESTTHYDLFMAYRGHAFSDYKKYVSGEAGEVNLKKYLVVIRAAICCGVIKRRKIIPKDSRVEELVRLSLAGELRDRVLEILRLKMEGNTKTVARDPLVEAFLWNVFEQEFPNPQPRDLLKITPLRLEGDRLFRELALIQDPV
jgi:predicted nucleotidyltransferase